VDIFFAKNPPTPELILLAAPVYCFNKFIFFCNVSCISNCRLDIFSDSVVTCDFCELIKKDRGAPKAWRKEPKTFIADLKLQVGNLVEVFKPLLEANTTSLDTTSTVDELTKPTKTGGYVAGDLDILPTNDYEENDDDLQDEDDE
jgi:hypothetical protein